MANPQKIIEYNKVKDTLKELGSTTNVKVSAWENELRDLQDKNQLKQFKIDKFETLLAKERLDKAACASELKKYKKEIDILFKNLKEYGYNKNGTNHASDL